MRNPFNTCSQHFRKSYAWHSSSHRWRRQQKTHQPNNTQRTAFRLNVPSHHQVPYPHSVFFVLLLFLFLEHARLSAECAAPSLHTRPTFGGPDPNDGDGAVCVCACVCFSHRFLIRRHVTPSPSPNPFPVSIACGDVGVRRERFRRNKKKRVRFTRFCCCCLLVSISMHRADPRHSGAHVIKNDVLFLFFVCTIAFCVPQ